MKLAQAKIADLWCRLMHTAPMWPAHGQYECRTWRAAPSCVLGGARALRAAPSAAALRSAGPARLVTRQRSRVRDNGSADHSGTLIKSSRLQGRGKKV
jgi:hypothetical protein